MFIRYSPYKPMARSCRVDWDRINLELLNFYQQILQLSKCYAIFHHIICEREAEKREKLERERNRVDKEGERELGKK